MIVSSAMLREKGGRCADFKPPHLQGGSSVQSVFRTSTGEKNVESYDDEIRIAIERLGRAVRADTRIHRKIGAGGSSP